MKRTSRSTTAPTDADAQKWAALHQRLEAMFRAEVGAQVELIETAIARRDWEAAAAGAHYLKSSASVVRDDRLFDCCGQVEDAAGKGDEAAVRRTWKTCLQALEPWRDGKAGQRSVRMK